MYSLNTYLVDIYYVCLRVLICIQRKLVVASIHDGNCVFSGRAKKNNPYILRMLCVTTTKLAVCAHQKFYNNSFLFATKVFIFYEWVLAYITLALMPIFAICANALEFYVSVRIFIHCEWRWQNLHIIVNQW